MTTRQLVRTALFAALTAVGAFLKIPLGPSAITLQFFFTAMAGCLPGSCMSASLINSNPALSSMAVRALSNCLYTSSWGIS